MKTVMGEAPYVVFTNHENSLSTAEGVPVIYTDEEGSRVDKGVKTLLSMMSKLNGIADCKTACKT